MVVERYMLKEVLVTLLGVLSVLMVIVVANFLVRYLADAAAGELLGSVIVELIGLKSVSLLTFVLPLATFLAVILGLGRLYKDSEVVVMSACGIGPGRLVLVMLALALPVAAMAAALVFYLAPWAAEQKFALFDQVKSQMDFAGVSAGRFHEAGGGQHVFYVERLSEDGKSLGNVFIQTRRQGRTGVIAAERGRHYVDPDTGDHFLVLEDGYRYEGEPGRADFRITRYRRHGLRLQRPELVRGSRKVEAVSTAALLASPSVEHRAELQWRIAVPLQVVLLTLLGVPLARTNPRQGRYARVFSAILVYLVYSNLATSARSWMERGELAPWLGLWWVHGLMAVFLVALLLAQSGALRGVLQRRGARLAAPG